MRTNRGFTRRDLIKGAAATAAAVGLGAVELGGGVGETLASIARAAEAPDLSGHRVIAVLPAGSGSGQVGIQLAPALGPQAITVAADGGIHLLDTINRRVVSLDQSGAVRGQTPVTTGYGRDLAFVQGGTLRVLGSDELVDLDATGSVRRRLPIAKNLAGTVTGLARGSSGEIEVEVEGADRVALTDRGTAVPLSAQGAASRRRTGLGAVDVGSTFAARYESGEPSRRGALIEVIGTNGVAQRLPVRVQSGVGATQVLGVDGRGNTYVVVDELLPGSEVRVDRTVRRYHPDGSAGQMARVPITGRHAWVERELALSPDGDVFALIVLADRALVLRLGFVDRLAPFAAVPGSSLVAALVGLGPAHADARELRADRTSAISTADTFYAHTWWCSYANWLTCGGTTRPGFVYNYNIYLYEVPYQWGGYRSTSQFDTDTVNSKTAGDVNSGHTWQNCATGVDCSGFIQNCWGQMATKYNDSGLTNFCTGTLGNTSLLNADMWRLPNEHVRLHNGYDGSVTGAYVYEASTANDGRVWWRFYSWSGLSGYTGWRWRGY